MIKATFFTSSFFLNNKQFDLSDKANMNDCLYGSYLLKKRFMENGINLSTQDINPPEESKFIIYSEMPKVKDIILDGNNYLLLLECEVIRPDNWDIKNHKYFKKIFTWNDDFIDDKKYFKINSPLGRPPLYLDFDMNKKGKFCVMIASHKFSNHPLELYSERLKTIRWFEKHHPNDFDLYGMGWDEFRFKGRLSRYNYMINRFKAYPIAHVLLRGLNFFVKYPSYRGIIDNKRETLQRYKFAICYENARDIPGYITPDKIFECFFAGCVPVYWGASNITQYIPSDTFIDRKKFKNHEELYNYLKNMSEEEYQCYLNAIKKFVKSDKIYPFSAEFYAETIAREVLKDIKKSG